MELNDIFCKIYVINLRRRIDRRILCTKKIERQCIKYNFIDAIDGHDTKYNNICTKLSRGALGLILTYIKILEDALSEVQNDNDKILIMEDDINFHKEFSNKVQNVSKCKKYDCIWLGANQKSYNNMQEEQISNEFGYYDVSKHSWCLTYGTFAIGMNRKMMIELRKSISINQFLYPIDVLISMVIAKNNLCGKVMYPFLIMPDVTDSDNGTTREQDEFVIERKFQISDYHYVSLKHISEFKNMLNSQKISLRNLFIHSLRENSTICDLNEFINIFESLNMNNKFIENYVDCFKINDKIDLNDFFNCIEEKKSFVFIIRSFNITNYQMVIESITKQIYPNYQYRIIFCNMDQNKFNIQCLNQYIETHKLCQCVEYVNLCTDVNNFCFDDEIVIDLSGNDWLFDEFVLDFLNDQYTDDNNIGCLHANGYLYQISDIRHGQSMGIPYGNQLINNLFNCRYNKQKTCDNKCYYSNQPLIICDKSEY